MTLFLFQFCEWPLYFEHGRGTPLSLQIGSASPGSFFFFFFCSVVLTLKWPRYFYSRWWGGGFWKPLSHRNLWWFFFFSPRAQLKCFYYPVLETGGWKKYSGYHQPPSHFKYSITILNMVHNIQYHQRKKNILKRCTLMNVEGPWNTSPVKVKMEVA